MKFAARGVELIFSRELIFPRRMYYSGLVICLVNSDRDLLRAVEAVLDRIYQTKWVRMPYITIIFLFLYLDGRLRDHHMSRALASIQRTGENQLFLFPFRNTELGHFISYFLPLAARCLDRSGFYQWN